MNNILDKVQEFYVAVGDAGYIDSEPRIIPNARRAHLKLHLIQEEVKELEEAMNNNDKVGIADALVDIVYVLAGAILEHGMANHFNLLFDEVHRSNMSKVPNGPIMQADTIRAYAQKGEGTELTSGSLAVRRLSDGKILKSVGYSPANLEPILSLTINDLPQAEGIPIEGQIGVKSNWTVIERLSGPDGTLITLAQESGHGVLLKTTAWNRNNNIQGIDYVYVPGMEIEERTQDLGGDGILVSYHLKGTL